MNSLYFNCIILLISQQEVTNGHVDCCSELVYYIKSNKKFKFLGTFIFKTTVSDIAVVNLNKKKQKGHILPEKLF